MNFVPKEAQNLLFDMERISAALLPQKEIRWFYDMGKTAAIPEDVLQRLRHQAHRWDHYVHPEYGDSYGEFARNRNRCNVEDMYINRVRRLSTGLREPFMAMRK